MWYRHTVEYYLALKKEGLWLSLDICLGVGLLGHMVAPFFIFKGILRSTIFQYFFFKGKEILTHVTTCLDLEDIMLSEINAGQKGKYCMIPLVQGA